MRNLANQLVRGVHYFGTSTRNTEEFNNFFSSFKRSFKRELNKINAKDLEMSKGHFHLSGFFTVQEQVIYFSISDVRGCLQTNWKGLPEMLIRKAKDYKDYTGGSNRYVAIESNMSREILRVCNLDADGFTKPTRKIFDGTKKAEKIVAELEKNGIFEGTLPSSKKADHIAWRVGEALGHYPFSITTFKRGRYKVKSEVKLEGFNYYYDAQSKRVRFTIKMTDVQLLKSLDVRDSGATRRNSFTGKPCPLEPYAVALHDLIKECENSGQYNLMQQALGIFREKYPNEYMVLLD